MPFGDKIVIPLSPYEERIVDELKAEAEARLAELGRLDRESEQLFTQGLLSHAVPIAKAYAKLKRQLEADRIECPPSVSMWRVA